MLTRAQFVVVVILLLAIGLIEAAPIVMPARTGPRWQYNVADIEDGQFLSEMEDWGDAGWELVFARRAVDSKGGGKPAYEVILKRPH